MSDKFRNKYRIPSARATWHKYDGGIYFVTICTAGKEHFFGTITCGQNTNDEPEMHLSEIGKIAADNLANTKHHYPYADVPLFVVMPNHIHAIVIIDQCDIHAGKSDAHTPHAPHTGLVSPASGCLATVIRGFKASVSRYAGARQISFAWQARYYDHIVRNDKELADIARYIETNVSNWATDIMNSHIDLY